jgi:hypothetical protein
MLRLALASLLAFGAGLFPIAVAHACTCAGLLGVGASIERSDLSFVGVLVASAPIGRDADGFGPLIGTTFAVERASMDVGAHVRVAAPPGADEGACGFAFDAADRWLVHAHEAAGVLRTSSCAENRPMEDLTEAELATVTELLRDVGAGLESATPATTWSDVIPRLVAVAVAVALAAALFVAGERRGRSRR